jgi:molecular chaperone DnaK
MRTATDKVAQASQALGAAMYAQAQQAGAETPAGDADGAPSSADDDVVDAEIVDEGEAK